MKRARARFGGRDARAPGCAACLVQVNASRFRLTLVDTNFAAESFKPEVTKYELTIAIAKLAIVTVSFAVATARLAIAFAEFALTIAKPTVVSVKLAVVTAKLAVASLKLWVAGFAPGGRHLKLAIWSLKLTCLIPLPSRIT